MSRMRTCRACGDPLGQHNYRSVTGLCKKCYAKTGHGRRGRFSRVVGRCFSCRQPKLCPSDKDPRYFICDDCRSGRSEYDGGERWLGSFGVEFSGLP